MEEQLMDAAPGQRPVHSLHSLRSRERRKRIAMLKHLPYSPNLAPYDFYLFTKVKSTLKGTDFSVCRRFQGIDSRLPAVLIRRLNGFFTLLKSMWTNKQKGF